MFDNDIMISREVYEIQSRLDDEKHVYFSDNKKKTSVIVLFLFNFTLKIWLC